MDASTRRYAIAGAIVTAGLCAAIPIYALAPADEDDPLDAYRHTKSYELGVERVGGKAALIGSQISDAIASLFHGATLGMTIGVLSIAIAAIYLYRTRKLASSEPRR